MLLSLHHLHPSSPPKTLQNSSSPFFSTPKTLILSYTTNPFHSFIRCSASSSSSNSNSQTLPHSAIQRIADKLRSLGFTEQAPKPQTVGTDTKTKTVGEIFIPLPNQLSKYRVGHTLDPSWSSPENPVPRPGSGNAIVRYHELREEVKKEREAKKREPRAPSLAKLNLSTEELRRLSRIGIDEKRKLKVGKAGITEGIVNGIHERWRREEVVKIVCEDLCRMNMKRTHDLLERKTGGMVVWRSGSKIVLYRGVNYKYPYFLLDKTTTDDSSTDTVEDINVDNGGDKMGSCSSEAAIVESSGSSTPHKMVGPGLIKGVGSANRVRFQLPGEAQLSEEVDRLLDGLGPRFTDWWGYEPLPVDADLLPAIVPGYRKPFRLLPYGIKSILTNDEMTTLKRLGRPLPCHFALGRNRKLQGLAASIVKLWEKCEIAKIAVKRGVQNTNSEMMAEELKWLTGGILLSRDREFIVLYRGKDFLPSAVSSAIGERRKHVIHMDRHRREHSISSETAKEAKVTKDVSINDGSRGDSDVTNDYSSDLSKQRKLSQNEAAIERTSSRLAMALEKKAKAEKLLAKLESAVVSQQPEKDKEGITNEERYMLRKVGLKMKPFLLLGRRGVFDGTVENMHLHWKYRELVKIICKEKSLEAVNEVAHTLEAESGGILVAVERVRKGYAIVVYRGKNYQRPSLLRPSTLLTKREAMKRSLEAQRHESLKLNILRLTKNINDLKHKLAHEEDADNVQPFDETTDRHEADLNSVISTDGLTTQTDSPLLIDGNGVGEIEPRFSYDTVSKESHAKQTTQTDSPLLLDCNWIGKTEPEFSSEAVSKETNAKQTTQTDSPMQFGGNGIGKTEPKLSFESVRKETHAVKTTQANSLIGTGIIEPPFSSESVSKETHSISFVAVNGGVAGSTSNTLMSEQRKFSPLDNAVIGNDTIRPTVESSAGELEESILISVKKENEMPSKRLRLSNKDRLLLRKQALKIKKRPVLAVGRSNIVSGVAKQIKLHFQKHPLAIVNIKGRAKGTSIQEVVFQLEQATGALLVSQEPSKVILYRGWGAFDEPGSKQDTRNMSVGGEAMYARAVSPELMAAIRLECGLPKRNQ
ncbi:CRM-domain containing factor CFM2, chloroplastic [Euphorbia lathyris]|uniref:CRM-domain containing factor CFM2, chloroplastic n=1 Tax=Euphorbia lathyris TaxID=212925 RepID=UPI003313BF74